MKEAVIIAVLLCSIFNSRFLCDSFWYSYIRAVIFSSVLLLLLSSTIFTSCKTRLLVILDRGRFALIIVQYFNISISLSKFCCLKNLYSRKIYVICWHIQPKINPFTGGWNRYFFHNYILKAKKKLFHYFFNFTN